MASLGKVLIGGGTGFIGRRLFRKLKHDGFEPLMVSRRTGDDCMTWNDLYRHGLPSNVKAVVNLAGEPVIASPFQRFDDDFKAKLRESRIGTTEQLIDAIYKAKIPPEVFVSGSAIGYYKNSETTIYTEDSGGGDFDFMSTLVTDWENAARAVRNDVRLAIIRTGLVLGREGGMIHRIWAPFWLGLGGPIGSGRQFMAWIHAEDITGIFAHAIKNPQVSGVLNGTAPKPATNAQFTKAFAKAMKRPAFIPVPDFVINAVYGNERGAMILGGANVYPKRTLESGYKFHYEDIESACEDCASLTVETSLVRP